MLPLAELARHIRRQRRLLGISQARLAADAGTSQSLIAKLEQGRLNPSYEAVRGILAALDRHLRTEEPVARQIMQVEPVYAQPEEPLGDALARMKSHGFSQLPVFDDGTPVGSLSERCVLARLDQGARLEDLKIESVRRIMEGSFPVVDPTTSRRVLVELLREHAAVLVMDQGRLSGLVTKSDLW